MDATIRTLSQAINEQGRMFDEQCKDNSILSNRVETLSYEIDMLVSFLDTARDDPMLLEPYTEEQLSWLQRKRRSLTATPVITSNQVPR